MDGVVGWVRINLAAFMISIPKLNLYILQIKACIIGHI